MEIGLDTSLYELLVDAAAGLPLHVNKENKEYRHYVARKNSPDGIDVLLVIHKCRTIISLYAGRSQNGFTDFKGRLMVNSPDTPRKIREHLVKYARKQ